MNNVSLLPNGFNATKSSWYEENLLLDLNENVLFSGVFVPPPPRPIFLNGSTRPDDLTTCDLCSWAWKRNKIRMTTSSFEIPSQAEWLFSLIIVSIISACLGAIAMMVLFHCRRSKKSSNNGLGNPVSREPTRNLSARPPMADPHEKDKIETIIPSSSPSENSVWCWLSKKSSGPPPLETISCSTAENHYTQMEEPYNNDDALYAELDMEDSKIDDNESTEPYQNQAFLDPDLQISSAPSSAYYSDLSTTPIPEQAYEVVNLSTINVNWMNLGSINKAAVPVRLAAISENNTVPSDYV